MKRKTLISVVVLVIMLLNCILPIFRVYAVESNTQSITLNSELYTAVSTYMKSNCTGFAYNDLLRTITASGSNFSSVENLDLKESQIDDISGLEVFSGLKTLDLSGNYLDLDSNLEIINEFSSLESLDLSTNKIDGFKWLTLENLNYVNFQRQSVENVKIISVEFQDTDEKDADKKPIKMPKEVVETTEGLISEFDLESRDLAVDTYTTQGQIWNSDGKTNGVQEGRETVGTDIIDYEDNKIILKNIYNIKSENKMYNIKAEVTNSKNKYYDSLMDLYYIIIDENEEGIIFKDENFYKSVKKQLSGETNLYSSAYDKALTLVIDKSVLLNQISELIADNEKIYDLTGLEKFVGLKENFSATYNYIDSIERIVELEENKAKMEEEIRQKISEQINKIVSNTTSNENETVSYYNILKEYVTKKDSINKEISELENKAEKTEEEQKKLEDLKKQFDTMKNETDSSMKKIYTIFSKIDKIYDKAEDMATIQTSALYEVTEVSSITNPDVAKKYLIDELQKLKTLEDNNALNDEVTNNIISKCSEAGLVVTSDATEDSEEIKPINNLLKFNNNDDINKLSLEKVRSILEGIKNQDKTTDVFNKTKYVGKPALNLYQTVERLVQNNTPEMLSVVVKLPRLKNLNLNVNNIESLEKIDTLTKLETLEIKENLITAIDNVDWTKLEKLNKLDLSKNQISNIDKLSELSPHLNYLNVSDCLLSGKFEFDFVKMGIKEAYFSGNYYDDLSYLMDKYYGKLKKSDYNSLVEYLTNEGYKFNFARQTVNVDYGNVSAKDNEPLTFGLPSIFADIEEIDPYNTTFGVFPGDGSVEEFGNTVTFAKYNNGLNTGKVTVETVNEGTNNQDNDSIGNGTTCYIKYTVGNSSEVVDPKPTDPTNPSEPVDPKPTTPTDPSTGNNGSTGSDINGSKEASLENVAIDEYSENKTNFIYIYEPDVTVASLAKLLNSRNAVISMNVESVNGNKDVLNDFSRVFTTEILTMKYASGEGSDRVTEDRTYEIVVLGDIDGDGDIDSIDSGYARALKYDTLYNDISSKTERIALMNAFKQTANYKAADMNLDEKITTDETASILYYRAGLLDSFKTFNK